MQQNKHCNIILTVHILRLFVFLKVVLVLPSQIFIILWWKCQWIQKNYLGFWEGSHGLWSFIKHCPEEGSAPFPTHTSILRCWARSCFPSIFHKPWDPIFKMAKGDFFKFLPNLSCHTITWSTSLQKRLKMPNPKKPQTEKTPNKQKNPLGSDNSSTWNRLINKWLGNKELRDTE